MKEVLQGIGIFLIVYVLWLFTGGPERGDERRALQENSILIANPLADINEEPVIPTE